MEAHVLCLESCKTSIAMCRHAERFIIGRTGPGPGQGEASGGLYRAGREIAALSSFVGVKVRPQHGRRR